MHKEREIEQYTTQFDRRSEDIGVNVAVRKLRTKTVLLLPANINLKRARD